jgi:hypothetical protein
VDEIEHKLSPTSIEYISERFPLDPSLLQPSLWTLFRRITLVGRGAPERLTIDIDLSFRHQDHEKSLPFLTICEVKRDAIGGNTEFMQILKKEHIYPGTSSKYCVGTVLLKEGVKYNRFKKTILKINKIGNVNKLSPASV